MNRQELGLSPKAQTCHHEVWIHLSHVSTPRVEQDAGYAWPKDSQRPRRVIMCASQTSEMGTQSRSYVPWNVLTRCEDMFAFLFNPTCTNFSGCESHSVRWNVHKTTRHLSRSRPLPKINKLFSWLPSGAIPGIGHVPRCQRMWVGALFREPLLRRPCC